MSLYIYTMAQLDITKRITQQKHDHELDVRFMCREKGPGNQSHAVRGAAKKPDTG